MNKIVNRTNRLFSRYVNSLFIHYKRRQVRSRTRQPVNILFSDKQSWKQSIRAGFNSTEHKLTFDTIAVNTISNYELVVPLKHDDVLYLTQAHHLIANNPLTIPSEESFRLCDDKYRFNEFLSDHGFDHLIPAVGRPIGYPYILKKKIDGWGQNSYIINDSQQEHCLAEKLAQPDYFTQEIIQGYSEYATHILFENGMIVCSLNIKYVFDIKCPIKGKLKEIYRRICYCPYLAIFSAILKCIEFEGFCCINYKVRDNKPMLLEINPRCGGSLCPYLFFFIDKII